MGILIAAQKRSSIEMRGSVPFRKNCHAVMRAVAGLAPMRLPSSSKVIVDSLKAALARFMISVESSIIVIIYDV